MDRDGAPLDLDPGGHLCWLPDIKTMMNMPKKEQQKYLWKILWLMYKNPPSMVGCCGCCEGKSLLLFPAPTNCHKIVESGVEQDGENIISSISHSVDWNLGEKVWIFQKYFYLVGFFCLSGFFLHRRSFREAGVVIYSVLSKCAICGNWKIQRFVWFGHYFEKFRRTSSYRQYNSRWTSDQSQAFSENNDFSKTFISATIIPAEVHWGQDKSEFLPNLQDQRHGPRHQTLRRTPIWSRSQDVDELSFVPDLHFYVKHIKLSSLFILIEKPGNETSAPHRLHERCFDHLTLFDLLLLLLLLLLLIVELFPCFIHLILSIAEIPVVYVFSCVFIWYSWFEAVGRGVEGTTETLMITLTLMMMMLKKALGWEKAPSSVFIIVNSWEQFTLCPPRLEIV